MGRRIVTGNNASGRSYIVSDDEMDEGPWWSTSATDPMGGNDDGVPSSFLPSTAPAIDPPAGGTKFLKFSIAPWAELKSVFADGAVPGIDDEGFHRTATIDYVMVVSGEVQLLLEDGEVTVRAGDLVIQRNTYHAWHNHSDQPTDCWAVLIRVDNA